MEGGALPMRAAVPAAPASRRILGMRVDATTYGDASDLVIRWAASAESRYVCAAPVHMVMEAYDDSAFQHVVNDADLVTADGMPVVWALRVSGLRGATRVYGPDLTLSVCARAAEEGVPVGFFGGAPNVLAALTLRLEQRFPRLRITYRFSPPYGAIGGEEDRRIVEGINASGARILFVGLGCPKQERWMAEHRGRVRAVMLGVGAAFDFIAGTKRQAPKVLRGIGLEWAFRLATEPRRLWRRYLRHNPRFLWFFAQQLVRDRLNLLGGPAA